jgi:hypothetical protein
MLIILFAKTSHQVLGNKWVVVSCQGFETHDECTFSSENEYRRTYRLALMAAATATAETSPPQASS